MSSPTANTMGNYVEYRALFRSKYLGKHYNKTEVDVELSSALEAWEQSTTASMFASSVLLTTASQLLTGD